MKKFISLVFFVFSFCYCHSQNSPFEGLVFQCCLEYRYCFKDGKYIKNEKGKEEVFPCEIKQKGAYLVGEVYYTEKPSDIYIWGADDTHIVFYDAYLDKEIEATNYDIRGIDEPWIWTFSDGFEATSYLTENLNGKKIEYKPDNLGCGIKKSWVEGVKSDGIGEVISFTNCCLDTGGTRRFYIINGFFSPEKPSLFYDNARVKTFIVRCYNKEGDLVNTTEVHLEDNGKMQLIEFSEKYFRFEYEIKEVYPGRKYHDTAITGIYYDALDAYLVEK